MLNSFLSDNFKKKRTLTLYYSQVIVLSDEILRRVKDLTRKFGNFDVGPNYNQRSGKKSLGGKGGGGRVVASKFRIKQGFCILRYLVYHKLHKIESFA